MKTREIIHGFFYALFAVLFLFILHHLPVNQLFIDPFSEAIKNHDIMDVSFSRFRDKKDPALFDNRIILLNSEVTNRKDISEVINFLDRSGVAAIGVDLLFDSIDYTAVDTALVQSLSRPNVIVGYTFEEHQNLDIPSKLGFASHPFISDHVHQGYVNLASDDGFSVRAYEPFHEVEGKVDTSFALKIASKIDPQIVEIADQRHHKKEWINFRRLQPGSANMYYPVNRDSTVHYAYTSVRQFLKDTSEYEKPYLKDKLILIGFSGENNEAISLKDRYFTPLNEKYTGRSHPDMYGVTVHANIISMLLDHDYINEIPDWGLYLFALIIFFMNYLFFIRLVKKNLFVFIPFVRVLQAVQFVILFTLCIIAITFFNLKIGFILIITAVVLSYELFEFYEHKLEKRVNKLLGK